MALAAPALTHGFELDEMLKLSGLSEAGITWDSAEFSGSQWQLLGVKAPGLRAKLVQVALGAPPRITVEDLTIDPSAWLGRKRKPAEQNSAAVDVDSVPASEPSMSPSADAATSGALVAEDFELPNCLLDLTIKRLRVQWRGRTIASDISVRINDGQLNLAGPQLSGSADLRDATRLHGIGRIDLAWLRGRIEAELTPSHAWPVNVRLRQLSVIGEIVGRKSMRINAVDMRVRRTHRGWDGFIDVGRTQIQFGSNCSGTQGCRFSATLPPTPVKHLLETIPGFVELPQRPQLRGDASAQLYYRLFGGPLELDACLDHFEVYGTGIDFSAYQNGPFDYVVPDSGGGSRTQRSGDDGPNWTPSHAMPPLLDVALQSAEDLRFFRHPGYDVGAMIEVVHDVVNRGRAWRGASTLTQQLVKNLASSAESVGDWWLGESAKSMI